MTFALSKVLVSASHIEKCMREKNQVLLSLLALQV